MSDDNKVKLLKIQHALLEALTEKKVHADTEIQRKRIDNELATCLLRYQELVTEIDYGIYRELQDKIKKLTDSEHTLEEELLELEDIETFYNQLLEIQSRFKETYARHSQQPLVLSNLEKLNIKVYSKRKEAIKAYLVNKKNISDNKKQLESINEQLITEEQKETRIEQKIMFLDEELVRRILSSEGRLLIHDENQETLKYTSIATEYQAIGIAIDKNTYTGRSFAEIEQVARETKEKLTAATISYEVMPDSDKKKILDEISLESIAANYHLVLVKILEEIYKPSNGCDEALRKREKINDLLQYRKSYLEKLGIKHGVDPFARLHINEQLNELRQYESNSRVISKLRRELANTNARIESLEAENVQNLTILEETSYDVKNLDYSAVTEEEPSFNDLTLDVIIPAEVHVLDNQVTSVTDLASDFNRKKCQEVTQGVIKRVYQLLTEPVLQTPQPSAPELVIEPKITIQEVENNSEILQSPKESTTAKMPEPVPVIEESAELFASVAPFMDAPEMPTAELPSANPDLILPNLSDDLLDMDSLDDELPELDDFPEDEESVEELPILQGADSEPIVTPQESEIPLEELQPLTESPEVITSAPITIESPEELPNVERVTESDLFTDTNPFENPPMFTEKIDDSDVIPDETPLVSSTPVPEVEFPEIAQESSTSEFSIELGNDQTTAINTDFWSTDANVNNITNMSLELAENISPKRKGL